VYFSFITFTTIGLGDFSPRGVERVDGQGAAGLAGYIFLIFFGLSVMGAFVAAVQDFMTFSRGLAKARLLKKKAVEDGPPSSEGSLRGTSEVDADTETGVTRGEEIVEAPVLPTSTNTRA
jgi:hypothetical protein